LNTASESPEHPVKLVRAEELRTSLAAAADWLERHRDAIDALNVFPVPDGDTGLNMSLTLRAAADEAAATDGSLSTVATAMAHGALMGARGNSGVILAQLLRGVARALEGHEAVDARLLASSLSAGADAAYSAVANPVEGTILTVARRAADAACAAAAGSLGLVNTLEHAHEAARVAVAETPELLPILKQASVVDSGGEGLRVVLEGILLHFRGESVGSGPMPVGMRVDFASLHTELDDFYGYCTEVLFRGEALQPAAIRARLEALGTCVLAVGDSEMMKIHVHTARPGAVLDMATELGEVVRVKIDNMQLQQQDFAAAIAQRPPEPPPSGIRQAGTSVVAVALGAGFQEILRSYGATVVTAERTMNPSVEEILRALDDAERTEVIILPNDRNALMAATQAAAQRPDRQVEVVPTASMPAGLAATLAINPDQPASANTRAMARAAERCHCIELTRAARSARVGDIEVSRGALFATLDDTPIGTGGSYPALLDAAIGLLTGDFEVATIYIGTNGSETEAEVLARSIRSRLDVEVDIASGGQPNYDYIISLE
jgi:DAK2 domain fusion protein YloV